MGRFDFSTDAVNEWFHDPPIEALEALPDGHVDDSQSPMTSEILTPSESEPQSDAVNPVSIKSEPQSDAGNPVSLDDEPTWLDLSVPQLPQLVTGAASRELAEHQELLSAKQYELAELDKQLENATAGVAMELLQRRRACLDQLEWLERNLSRVRSRPKMSEAVTSGKVFL
jgi:hypothetical protein